MNPSFSWKGPSFSFCQKMTWNDDVVVVLVLLICRWNALHSLPAKVIHPSHSLGSSWVSVKKNDYWESITERNLSVPEGVRSAKPKKLRRAEVKSELTPRKELPLTATSWKKKISEEKLTIDVVRILPFVCWYLHRLQTTSDLMMPEKDRYKKPK